MKQTHTQTRRCTLYIICHDHSLPLSLCQSLSACDPVNVRNARSAVIEALPHMLSSMALLWGAILREEIQKRASDSAQSSRSSSASVYFKSTKVCVCVTYMQMVLFTIIYQYIYQYILVLLL